MRRFRTHHDHMAHHEHPCHPGHPGHPGHRDRGEFGFGRPGPRGPRARRGDIRFALLSALTDGPAHGYEIIQRLEDRTGGRWKPSPGSVYPTLQMMEEAGLVTGSQQDEKRVYTVTPAGQKALDERATEGPMPWMNADAADGHGAFRHSLGQLVMAAKQVANSGNPQLVEQAAGIMNDARRKLYQLLADA